MGAIATTFEPSRLGGDDQMHLMTSTLAGATLSALLITGVIAQQANTDALKAVADTADRICGVLATSGEKQSTTVSGQVKGELSGLAKKLADLGIQGTGSIESSSYAGVLQTDLASSLSNQRDCKLKVFGSLADKVIVPVDRPQATKVCRIPANGVERYQREVDVTRESGWRGGGYDQNRWCNDVIAIMAGENPQGQFTVTGKSEQQKNTCSPFNCPQYNYFCTVHVQADPLFKEAASSQCP
jgi:hypothetical protein